MGDVLVTSDEIHVSTQSNNEFLLLAPGSDSTFNSTTDFSVINTAESFYTIDQSIVISLDGGTGIEDVPYNSQLYVRSNGTWVEMPEIPSAGVIGPKGDTGDTGPAGTLDPAIANQVTLLSNFRNTALGLTTANEDRYISVFDLIEMGVLRKEGSGFDYLVPNEDIFYTGPAVVEVPPVPKNFKVVGGFGHIQLFWEPAKLEYTNHYVTQIWRGTSSSIGAANLLANVTLSYHYVDTTALLNSTYYYWIRFTNTEGMHGPFTTSNSYGVAKFDPDAIKNSLVGLIDESLLAEELLTPIQSITELEIDSVQLRTDLLDMTGSLSSAITSEAEYRALAILNEASARGTAIDELLTVVETTEESIINRLNFLTNVFGEGYDTTKIWQFDLDAEGWTGGTTASGKLTPTFSTDTAVVSSDFIVDGSIFDTIRMRVIRVGSPVWEGAVYYTTTFEDEFSNARVEQIPEPIFFSDQAIAVWDMAAVSDWDISIITSIKVVLAVATSATDYYAIDWVNIGRIVGGDSIAGLVEEVNLVTAAGEATAESLTDLAIQVRGEYEGVSASAVTAGLIHDAVQLTILGDVAQGQKSDIIEVGVRDLKRGVGDLEGAISGWKQLASSTEYKQVQTVKEGALNEYLEDIVTDSETGIQTVNNALTALGLTVADQIVSTGFALESLEASVAENEGRITEVQAIAAGANLVVTSQLNTLSAQLVDDISTVTALITSEATARVTAVDSVASLVTTLRSDFEVEKGEVDLRIAAGIEDADLVTSTEFGGVATRLATTEVTIYGPEGNPAAGLSAKVVDTTGAIAELGGLVSATRTIKLNVNTGGKFYAAGMGISLTNESGTVQSEVAFIADTFRIMHNTDGTLTQPFYVASGNVYIQNAFIRDASITAAKIVDATITNAQIANATISFAKISDTLQSTNYVANASGWRILKDGTSEFQNVKARGDIEAQSLKSGTAMVDTLNVNGGAVTSQYYASSGGGAINQGNAISGLAPISITMPSGSTGVVFTATLTATGTAGSNDSTFTASITKNGSALSAQSWTALRGSTGSFTVTGFDSSPAGTNTYAVHVYADLRSTQVYGASLMAAGGKR